MFGLLSGLVASSFIGVKKNKGEGHAEIIERLNKLEDKIDALSNKNSKG